MYEEIIALLRSKKGKYRQISNETGLTYDWLLLVARGQIEDPGIKKMEQLHSYLIAMESDPEQAA